MHLSRSKIINDHRSRLFFLFFFSCVEYVAEWKEQSLEIYIRNACATLCRDPLYLVWVLTRCLSLVTILSLASFSFLLSFFCEVHALELTPQPSRRTRIKRTGNWTVIGVTCSRAKRCRLRDTIERVRTIISRVCCLLVTRSEVHVLCN